MNLHDKGVVVIADEDTAVAGHKGADLEGIQNSLPHRTREPAELITPDQLEPRVLNTVNPQGQVALDDRCVLNLVEPPGQE